MGLETIIFAVEVHNMGRKRTRVIHLILALVPLAMIFAFIAKLAQARRETREAVCKGSLFYIGAQLANYRDRHGHFPPTCTLDGTGRPRHSWRAILYAEMEPSFRQTYDFSEPWNSPHNIRVAEHPPSFFCCKNNQGEYLRYTNYVALINGTDATPGYITARGQDRVEGGGIVLIEYPNSQILWTEPKDLTLDQLPAIAPGFDPGGIAILLADRTVRRISKVELLGSGERNGGIANIDKGQRCP